MKRLIFLIITISLFFPFLLSNDPDAAVMEDYCQVPPYVIQNVAPNVMIVLDNSGSMFYFAYFDGFNTTATGDDNLCATIGSPCTGFTNPGTYPTYKYYGYFNPDYWYVWDNPRFRPAAKKTETRPANSWDGNFLNWLMMRRIDVIRKVMTGGKTTSGEGSGYDRLIGEIADCDDRGKYKRINNAQDYTPYSGNRKFYVYSANAGCGGGGSGTSSFGVRNASDGSDGTGNEATFNVAVRVPVPVEGVLQRVVGARARMGLSFYRVNSPTPHGGYVRVNVASGSLSSTVNEINLTRPNSNTPLAETLWMVTGYFAQQATIEGGPGPMYGPSSNYTISNNADPLNYGTGGQPRWPSCSKSFVLYITDGEPCADGYLPNTIRDYASGRSDFNCQGTSCPAVGSFPASTFPSCTGGGESASCGGIVSGCYVAGIEDVALYMHTTDLRSATLGKNDIPDKQNLTLYAVFAFGKGSTLLRYAAINGGFEDSNSNNIPDLQSEWDNNNDGEPDNFYEATEGSELERAIEEAFLSILKRASSGTAASVLASGEGQGANLIQAVFYPRRRFGNDIISWTGSIQNLWFYLDPDLKCINIREDTNPDKILHFTDDYITQLYFDTTAEETRARRWTADTNPDDDICIDTPQATVDFENLLNLWEAGKLLWSRDITADPRTIYTTIDGSSIINFSTTKASDLREYLQATTNENAEKIIRYIHGEDIIEDTDGDFVNDYRLRTVTIGSDTHVWKLGDILNSTPRIASWIPLNEYHRVYKDNIYGPTDPDLIKLLNLNKLSDPNYYLTSDGYIDRGMVFAGGNDGMLHAFKLGKLDLEWDGQGGYQKARLTGTDLGKEMWSFIPKGALPYLKYLTDPDYCHIYTVDLSPFIFDASINGNPDDTKDVNSWRTILIGGMRFGGACRGTTASCTDCVKTPVDVGGSSVGFSSYFALDITDNLANPANPPVLLWEFTNPQLGFATTGPAVVRINAAGDPEGKNKNGNWFVVFGSGPTGPIDTTNWQFMGRSDQPLRLFVIGPLSATPGIPTVTTISTGISNAFAGSMINSTYDHKLANYQDDAVYIPYVKKAPDNTWTQGGVLRLLTKEDTNPNNWASSIVMDNIGPVTSSVTHLYSTRHKNTWLFFGTGRYYYELTTETDDTTGQRILYGVKEPCVTPGGDFDPVACSSRNFCLTPCSNPLSNPPCTSPTSCGDLTNVTSISCVGGIGSCDVPITCTGTCGLDPVEAEKDPNFKGWYINLDPCTDSSGATVSCTGSSVFYWAERTITDPVASPSTGAVFYTTYKPYNDECGIGGKTHLWAVKYSTGGEVASSLKGKALLQVSTAAIEEVSLSSAFTEKKGRRTPGMEGVPPTAQGLVVVGQCKPVKRVIHMRER